MKIAVNTRLLLKDKLEGIGWFTYESLKRIVERNPKHEFYFIFDRKYSEEFIFAENVTPIVIGPPARHPILFFLWYEISIPMVLKRLKPDIFLSPDAFLSLRSRFTDLIVIHDLNFEHFPEHMPLVYRWYYKFFTPRYARKATRIATVSEFSRNDISEQYNVEKKKIDVLYNGTNSQFSPLKSEEKKLVRDRYTNGKKYFVFVGAFNPRKNLQNIFKAFDSFKDNDDSGYKFVAVGEKMFWSKEIEKSYNSIKHKGDVIFTGRLNPDELSKIVGASEALVYTSFFEGFGIPIIEAFNAEVPVITSNVSSMPEIAGDAAILVNPDQYDEIAVAMENLSKDEKLRLTLVGKGRTRRELFSWDKTSDNLWRSINKTIETNQNQKP